jgi:hypothetical protein
MDGNPSTSAGEGVVHPAKRIPAAAAIEITTIIPCLIFMLASLFFHPPPVQRCLKIQTL